MDYAETKKWIEANREKYRGINNPDITAWFKKAQSGDIKNPYLVWPNDPDKARFVAYETYNKLEPDLYKRMQQQTDWEAKRIVTEAPPKDTPVPTPSPTPTRDPYEDDIERGRSQYIDPTKTPTPMASLGNEAIFMKIMEQLRRT